MSSRFVRSIVVMATVAAAAPGVALADQGLSVRADADPWPRMQGRLALSTADTGALLDSRDDPAALRSLSVMGDYYLTGSWFGARRAGGLRATSALLIGPRWQTLGAGSLGLPNGNGLVVERRLPTLTPEADERSTLPYLGIGYTGLSPQRGGFSFSADLGVVALTPGTAVRFGRAFSSGPNLDDAVRDLRLSPMLQLGVSYSF